ncbi:MAG: FtsX-like permease family protein [Rikenellaceae bacterium]
MTKIRLLQHIANRYLFSKKSHSVVNIISVVSALSLSVPVAAMIILLSVHNGLSNFIVNLNSSFEPDLKITSNEGHLFEVEDDDFSSLSSIKGVSAISKVLEHDVMLEYKGKYTFLKARGVDSLFGNVIPISSLVVRGKWHTQQGALLGLTTVYELTHGGSIENSIILHSPQSSQEISFLPIPLYRSSEVEISGIYSLDTQTELKYIIIPISTAEDLFDKEGSITSIFIDTDSTANFKDVRSDIEEWTKKSGNNLSVITQDQEQLAQYNILKQEKFAIYIILSLVLLVASFTLIGAVVMLMIEKEEETKLLSTLGLKNIDIRRIFIIQGLTLASYGIAFGTIIGVSISLLQQTFGFVKIGGSSPLLDSYPICLSATDTIISVVTVFVLSLFIVIFTVKSNKNNG